MHGRANSGSGQFIQKAPKAAFRADVAGHRNRRFGAAASVDLNDGAVSGCDLLDLTNRVSRIRVFRLRRLGGQQPEPAGHGQQGGADSGGRDHSPLAARRRLVGALVLNFGGFTLVPFPTAGSLLIDGRRIRLRHVVLSLGRRQLDRRPSLAGGAHGEGQPADGNHLKGLEHSAVGDRLPVDPHGAAGIEHGQANAGLRGEQAEMPARQPVVLQNEVAVLIAAEHRLLLDQRHFGASVNARQYLQCPMPFGHVRRPLRVSYWMRCTRLNESTA